MSSFVLAFHSLNLLGFKWCDRKIMHMLRFIIWTGKQCTQDCWHFNHNLLGGHAIWVIYSIDSFHFNNFKIVVFTKTKL